VVVLFWPILGDFPRFPGFSFPKTFQERDFFGLPFIPVGSGKERRKKRLVHNTRFKIPPRLKVKVWPFQGKEGSLLAPRSYYYPKFPKKGQSFQAL